MMGKPNIETFFSIINTLCSVAFILQFCAIISEVWWPENTNTGIFEHKLFEIDFPVIFKLCATDAWDEIKLNEYGYMVCSNHQNVGEKIT